MHTTNFTIAGVWKSADACIIFCIWCIFLAKTMVEGAVYCIFYVECYCTFCIILKQDTGEKRLIASLWATNNWLHYAEIRLFGSSSLRIVSSVSIEISSFQFNHEQQLKQQRSLSLLFLSEHIILLGCSLRFAAQSGLPAAMSALLYE